jgi:predicted ATP-grasp superfamily ATP-dependent carboligase
MESESKLVQRRKLKGRQYYRVFTDHTQLKAKLDAEEKILYQHKEHDVSLEDSVVVRWGTREVLPTNGGSVVYNRINAIENATNKLKSRELFIEHGVSAPKLIKAGEMGVIENIEEEDFPIIARPHVHSKGKNFVILRTLDELEKHWANCHNGWYYSAFVDKTSEFRIHCAHGKALAVMEKPRPVDGNIAWNRAQNDVDPFDYVPWGEVDERGLKPVIAEAIRACKALGLDFGGVDVIMKDNAAYVLEVNTAPTLNSSPYVAKRWGMYFDWLFRQDKRREHWLDFDQKKEGKSMIWKNKQLNE